MKLTALLWVFLCSWVFAAGTSPAVQTDFPVNIAYVKEMGFIPEVDGWERCAAAEFAADSQKVAGQWDTLRLWVRKQYTAATVRALSGWAKKEMAAYKRTPSLKGLSLVPIRAHQEHKKVVFQGVVDSLPVHAPIVTRHLTLYVLYDSAEGKIVGVTVTIRGEILE